MRTRTNIAYKVALMSTCLMTPALAVAQEADSPEEDAAIQQTIVVTGRRAADREALDAKRNADSQVDQIRSDDVGRLPDQNVAEAVGRLPGVSVANDQGEGRYLTVRGVSPDMLNVTLNGQTAAAPEPESRQVKLDDIPSGLIGAVTVVKTLTPDRDANAIAGQADIETVTAFDKEGPFTNLRAAYGYNEINGENPYEADGSIGRIFGENDQFGVVLAFNHSARILGSQNFQSGASYEPVNGFDVPLEQTLRLYNTERKRTGAVANFDWRPTDTIQTYARFMYSIYDDTEERPGFTVALDEDEITNQTPDSGDFVAAEGERALRSRKEETNTLTASFGGEFDIGDNWLNLEATFTRAEKNDPNRDEWVFVAEDITGSYDLGGDKFQFFPDASAYDATNYEFDEIGFENREAVENLFQAQADYRHAIDFGDDSSLKFGVKYLDREKTSDENAMIYDGYDGDLTLDMFAGPGIGSIFDGRYPFGVTVNHNTADAIFAANTGDFEL
ncbi:MAG: TonB-dependent receptor plug domain-containing protein, partial [Henriciella sp.]